jgi:hypothetical protein
MNQEQVKEKLLKLKNDIPEFSLIFSGKKSKRVDGLYKPDTKEIIIHNKNHKTENELIYTAIHEFAHHVQFCENPLQRTARSHNTVFWTIFHKLLYQAEQDSIFVNIFKSDPEFADLTRNIKDNFLSKHGNLMKEFGKLLLKAMDLCLNKNVSFEDYLSRELLMDKTEVKNIIKVSQAKVDPSVGYDNMVMLSKIKDEDKKSQMEKAMLDNKISPPMIKEEFKKKEPRPLDKLEFLMSEKVKLERTIKTLEDNLKNVKEKIDELKANKK